MPSKKLLIIVSLLIVCAMGCAFETFESAPYIAPGDPDSGDLDLGAGDMSSPSDAESDQGGPGDAAGLDSGPDAANDAANDGGIDTGNGTGDMGTMSDASADAGCLDIVEPLVNLTSGTVCTPYVSDIAGECDPVSETGCPAGERCVLRILSDAGVPSGFAAVCGPYDCSTMVRGAGDACAPNQCAPGLKCVSGQCRRWCRLDDAEGCPPGEFCVGESISRQFGMCRSTCS